MIKRLFKKAKQKLDKVADRTIHIAIIIILSFALLIMVFMLCQQAVAAHI